MNTVFVRISTLLVLVAGPVASGCGGATAGHETASPAELTTLDGTPTAFDAAALQRPTLMVFWASWCAPCRAEAPALAALKADLGDKLDIMGVNVDENIDDARAFVAHFGVGYPSIRDPELAFSDAHGVSGVPMLVLYARGGAEVARSAHLGELDGAIACQTEGKDCK